MTRKPTKVTTIETWLSRETFLALCDANFEAYSEGMNNKRADAYLNRMAKVFGYEADELWPPWAAAHFSNDPR